MAVFWGTDFAKAEAIEIDVAKALQLMVWGDIGICEQGAIRLLTEPR